MSLEDDVELGFDAVFGLVGLAVWIVFWVLLAPFWLVARLVGWRAPVPDEVEDRL